MKKIAKDVAEWVAIMGIMGFVSAVLLVIVSGLWFILHTPFLLIAYVIVFVAAFDSYATFLEPIESHLIALLFLAPVSIGTAVSLRTLTWTGIFVWIAVSCTLFAICFFAVEKRTVSEN